MEKSLTLVVLPGLDGTDVFFRSALARLPASVRAVVVNYPTTARGNSYGELLEHARAQVAALPGGFFVLGSSFAGPLAVMLAAAEPARVRGLILAASFLRAPDPRLRRWRFAAVTPVIWAFRAWRRLPVWTLRRRDDPFRQAKAETWRRVSARCLAARVRAVLGVDVRELFQRCELPVLCLTFAEDRVVPPRCGEEIRALRPALVRTVTIPGGHLAMCHDPGRWAEEVMRFLNATGADPLACAVPGADLRRRSVTS